MMVCLKQLRSSLHENTVTGVCLEVSGCRPAAMLPENDNASVIMECVQ